MKTKLSWRPIRALFVLVALFTGVGAFSTGAGEWLGSISQAEAGVISSCTDTDCHGTNYCERLPGFQCDLSEIGSCTVTECNGGGEEPIDDPE